MKRESLKEVDVKVSDIILRINPQISPVLYMVYVVTVVDESMSLSTMINTETMEPWGFHTRIKINKQTNQVKSLLPILGEIYYYPG